GTAMEEKPLPREALVIVPIRQTVLFPGMVLPVSIGRPRSIAAVQYAARNQRPLGILLQRDSSVEDPGPEHLYKVGTSVELLRYVAAEEGIHHAICRGVRRFRVVDFLPEYPFLAAHCEEVGVSQTLTPEIEARVRLLRERAREAIQLLPNMPAEIANAIESLT